MRDETVTETNETTGTTETYYTMYVRYFNQQTPPESVQSAPQSEASAMAGRLAAASSDFIEEQ